MVITRDCGLANKATRGVFEASSRDDCLALQAKVEEWWGFCEQDVEGRFAFIVAPTHTHKDNQKSHSSDEVFSVDLRRKWYSEKFNAHIQRYKVCFVPRNVGEITYLVNTQTKKRTNSFPNKLS